MRREREQASFSLTASSSCVVKLPVLRSQLLQIRTGTRDHGATGEAASASYPYSYADADPTQNNLEYCPIGSALHPFTTPRPEPSRKKAPTYALASRRNAKLFGLISWAYRPTFCRRPAPLHPPSPNFLRASTAACPNGEDGSRSLALRNAALASSSLPVLARTTPSW